jgi:hypothetical protein
MQPFPRADLGITRFDSRSGRPTFQDLADMGSRSVTGHCNRSGRDARVILRGASLGEVYEARWWPDWTGTGWRTVTAPLFPDIRINALSEGYSPRAGQMAGRPPRGRRGTAAMLARPHRSGRAAGGGRTSAERRQAVWIAAAVPVPPLAREAGYSVP